MGNYPERDWSNFIDDETKKAIGSATINEGMGGITYALKLLKEAWTEWGEKNPEYPTNIHKGCGDARMILDIDYKFLGIKNLSNGRIKPLVEEGMNFLRKKGELKGSYNLKKDIVNCVDEVLVPKNTYTGELYKYNKMLYLIVPEDHPFQKNVYIDLNTFSLYSKY
ncbi:MAG: hypothetical protein KAT28_00590 [Candidatus Aenigmarchaeota archaeon]|nr:hypothetical protein [Candidatus Aenigmarchaeota archaeon]